MKKVRFFYFILLPCILLDAWLLAHPNTLGKLGIWIYHYDLLRTFSRALATVGLSTLVLALVSEGIGRFLPFRVARILYVLLLIFCLILCFQTIQQFSTGMYARTGTGFRWGGMLLPVIYISILCEGLWQAVGRKKKLF